MSALELLPPPRIIASLHTISCAGPSDCSCDPTYVVERRNGERPIDHPFYTARDGVASSEPNTDNMRAARIGATPPVRAARHSGVDE